MVDWNEIRMEYIQGGVSYRELAANGNGKEEAKNLLFFVALGGITNQRQIIVG